MDREAWKRTVERVVANNFVNLNAILGGIVEESAVAEVDCMEMLNETF